MFRKVDFWLGLAVGVAAGICGYHYVQTCKKQNLRFVPIHTPQNNPAVSPEPMADVMGKQATIDVAETIEVPEDIMETAQPEQPAKGKEKKKNKKSAEE